MVFVRERRLRKAVKYRIVDKTGRCVSVTKGGRHSILTLKPGRHRLYVLVGQTRVQAVAVQLDLAPKRTYVVEIRTQVKRKDSVDIHTVRPNTARAATASQAIRESELFEPDVQECSEWVVRKGLDIQRKLEWADAEWSQGGDAYREEHSPRRKDGFPPAEARQLFE